MDIHLTKKDFKIDWFSGTGAGGQHRNKHMNCCRIVHIETGLMATGQSNRDRPSNQREAFKKLAGMIIALYDKGPEERQTGRNVVRTYHFDRNIATDGTIEKPVSIVMEGDIDRFIVAALTGQRKIRESGRM